MAILLPFISGILLYFICLKIELCWRNAILTAAIIWGCLVVLITESLSLFQSLDFSGLVFAWCFVSVCLIYSGIRLQAFHFNPGSWRSNCNWRSIPTIDWLLVAGVMMICGITGAIAVFTPPNNWDSMAYTLPRVMHWLQNHSVAHYPTHYTPQLYNGVWAEFSLLHFQVLAGSDVFANFLQWFCLLGSLIAVSLIAEYFGCDRRGQLFAVVLCATLPNGILQASNTKNTYVVAFWLVCFVWYGLLSLRSQLNWKLTGKIAASLGLAVLTKGTAYAYAIPFGLWIFCAQIYILQLRAFRHVVLTLLLILVINSGHYARNLVMFGSPTSTYPYQWRNDLLTPPIFVSNVIRNAGLHATLAPFLSAETVDRGILQLH